MSQENTELRQDPANEEMKQPEPGYSNRLLQAGTIRREVEQMRYDRNFALHQQQLLGLGASQVEQAARRRLEQSFLSTQLQGISSRPSSSWASHSHQPLSASAVFADVGSTGSSYALLGGDSLGGDSLGSRLPVAGTAHRSQVQVENLLLQQPQQLIHRTQSSTLFGANVFSSSVMRSNTSVPWFSSLGQSSGMAFNSQENQSILTQPNGMLEGMIRRPMANEWKEEEDDTTRPVQRRETRPDEDEGDQEEDDLDDDAFYRKRNSVDTIEDLHLHNETFPMKLYRMLYEVSKSAQADIVSWVPHGRAFIIHNQEEFSKILSAYFSTDRMASFQRQLNLYGFRRITTEGKDKGAFFHEKFINGRRSRCKKINRKRVNRKSSPGVRQTVDQLPSSLSAPSHHGVNQRDAQASRLAASRDFSSIVAGQANVGDSLERRLMMGSAHGAGSELLGLGARHPLFGSTSPSLLLQQQQLQQRLQQQRLMNQQRLEQENARRASQPR